MALIIPSISNATPVSNMNTTPRDAAPTQPARPDFVDTTMFRNPYAAPRDVRIYGVKPLPVFFKNDEPAQKCENEQPGLIEKLQSWLGNIFG